MWTDNPLLLLGWIGVAVLVVLCALVAGLIGCLWRQGKRREAWEVIEVAPKGETPEGQLITRRRQVRRVDTSAPWDDEPRPLEAVTFPDVWRHDWPDPLPEPSKLPDEER